MNTYIEFKPSEGEEFLEDFFIMLDIEFEPQKKIYNLKYDTKQFRTADFYLPKYKLYVEFFGLWNNSGNEEYRLKKDIYRQNGIPCVYIYPENLGIIEFTFDKRIQSVLEKHDLQKELHSYKNFKFRKTNQLKNRVIYIVIALFILFYTLPPETLVLKDKLFIAFMVAIVIYQTFQIYQLYLDIFKRNKFSLVNLY